LVLVVLVSIPLTQVRRSFLSSLLGSVYLGKDIRTGAEIALKIGCAESADHSPSRLGHEYSVYTAMGSSAGISPVRWYGKEGTHEVIVLDYLGNSLGDLIRGRQVSDGKTFLYAPQMVRSPCT
jgi:casein kinase 1 epsilon